MFEGIDFDDFFSKTREFLDSKVEVLAVSIITPSQTVHAHLASDSIDYLSSDYNIVHEDIFDYVLGELYDIGKDVDVKDYKGRMAKRKELGIAIRNRADNFVAIRYIISEYLFMTIVEIPSFITSYQFNELAVLNEKIKAIGFDIGVNVTDYNPMLVSKDKNLEVKTFEEKENISLDLALEYLLTNGRVVDYDSPFGVEIPFYGDNVVKKAS